MTKDLKELKDLRANKDRKDLKATKDLKDRRATKDLKELKDLRANKDRKDLKELKDRNRSCNESKEDPKFGSSFCLQRGQRSTFLLAGEFWDGPPRHPRFFVTKRMRPYTV
ncbi:hypothetical protein [Cohnella sp. CFH 77786]|uniref:hypothetical protein n=1 Tax=Cohnella sp. CFH 77786 TaxID=2662265 RepID=UPI001C60F199|nr:hypothetical protein [Cohnella sp. CFH 77786]